VAFCYFAQSFHYTKFQVHMVICQNAEGVYCIHDQKKVGNPCPNRCISECIVLTR